MWLEIKQLYRINHRGLRSHSNSEVQMEAQCTMTRVGRVGLGLC
jgi:hypothetical protein